MQVVARFATLNGKMRMFRQRKEQHELSFSAY